nr:MAG TPA: hypothetical protein [Caudoviricetes sp.]
MGREKNRCCVICSIRSFRLRKRPSSRTLGQINCYLNEIVKARK